MVKIFEKIIAPDDTALNKGVVTLRKWVTAGGELTKHSGWGSVSPTHLSACKAMCHPSLAASNEITLQQP